MVQLKNIITRVLSGAVFFMAIQVGVAQEKAAASATDKVEVASVEANVLAGTVQKMNTYFAQNKVNSHADVVMKEPAVKETKNTKGATVIDALTPLHWYLVANDRTLSATPQYFGTKAEIIAAQGCKDESAEICLYGSPDDDVPEDTDVSEEDPSQLIMQNNP